jgi:hypothetical protein
MGCCLGVLGLIISGIVAGVAFLLGVFTGSTGNKC